jgi:ADP-heptose:LPS heptosyltransferase
VAAAFGTPQLVLFGPSDEQIWYPWRTPHQILKSDPIHHITLDQAIEALQKLERVPA